MRKFVLLFAGALLFHLAGTWTLPLIDRDEPRFAEASREMLQRGDYVLPFFNNRYRFDKPPLTYWAQTLSYRVFGDNDFAARFPSAVAASLVGVVLLAWGCSGACVKHRTQRVAASSVQAFDTNASTPGVLDERVGWYAAIIFTLCLQTLMHAKAAVADMWLVLFVAAAHWAGYELLRDRLGGGSVAGRRRWWWIFYLALAFGFLAKGPIGCLPLLTLAATKLLIRDLDLNRRFLFFTGLVFAVSTIAMWGVPALQRTQGEFFRIGIGRHVVERSVVAMEGHGASSIVGYIATLPFFFLTVFASFAPWSLKLPWLARKLWRNRDGLDNYLLAGAGVIFLIFTLVKTKLPHYTLPAFPLLALLLARHLPKEGRFIRRAGAGFVIIALLGAAATPFAAQLFPSSSLARQARADLKREMEFGAIGYREPSLVWYFRQHIDGFMTDLDEASAPAFMEKAGPRFVVMPSAVAGRLYPTLPPNWKSYTTSGISTANGKRVQLTLLLKPF